VYSKSRPSKSARSKNRPTLIDWLLKHAFALFLSIVIWRDRFSVYASHNCHSSQQREAEHTPKKWRIRPFKLLSLGRSISRASMQRSASRCAAPSWGSVGRGYKADYAESEPKQCPTRRCGSGRLMSLDYQLYGYRVVGSRFRLSPSPSHAELGNLTQLFKDRITAVIRDL